MGFISSRWLSEFLEKHPRLLLAGVLVLGLVTFLAVFAATGKPVVVYQGF